MRVDAKIPPFVCRGRQFILRPVLEDEEKRNAMRRMIRKRLIGQTMQGIRESNEEQTHRCMKKKYLKERELVKMNLEKLNARLRNLEQQQDTLKMILAQFDKQRNSNIQGSEIDYNTFGMEFYQDGTIYKQISDPEAEKSDKKSDDVEVEKRKASSQDGVDNDRQIKKAKEE